MIEVQAYIVMSMLKYYIVQSNRYIVVYFLIKGCVCSLIFC